MKRRKLVLLAAAFVALLCIATVGLSELTITLLLNNNHLLEGNLLRALQKYYMQKDRMIIQYMSECGRYDDQLAYTLRSGKCRIRNREFDIEYSINSMGMRDDEQSLDSPQIVVVGDSHAMGWGVNQDQTIEGLLENRLRKPVLNASISSYGTVRELKILERFNLDRLEYLIIQYCSNDIGENRRFSENDNTLPTMTKEQYHSLQESHEKSSAYYIGKHIFNLTKNLVSLFESEVSESGADPNQAATEEVELFLNVLVNAPIDLKNVSIIVFEVNSFAENDSLFIETLNLNLGAAQEIAKSFRAIDLSSLLGKEAYFHLDDHISSVGHQIIADILVSEILGIPSLER